MHENLYILCKLSYITLVCTLLELCKHASFYFDVTLKIKQESRFWVFNNMIYLHWDSTILSGYLKLSQETRKRLAYWEFYLTRGAEKLVYILCKLSYIHWYTVWELCKCNSLYFDVTMKVKQESNFWVFAAATF